MRAEGLSVSKASEHRRDAEAAARVRLSQVSAHRHSVPLRFKVTSECGQDVDTLGFALSF